MVSHRQRCLNGVTTGGISMLGFAVLLASNCAGLRNITLHWLHALKGVSYRAPVLRSTLTRWKRSNPHSRQRHWLSVMAQNRSQLSRWPSIQCGKRSDTECSPRCDRPTSQRRVTSA